SMPDGFNAIALEFGGAVDADPIRLIFDEIRLASTYEGLSSPTVVSVHNKKSAHPTEFGLHQNYPNPFNPVTQISFSLSREATVTLRIFDVIGKEIAVLVRGERKSAGTYQYSFDGSGLSSGTYFCQLQTNSSVETKKMTLLK
ncbi:MAG: T9SS type A sorting domain-containing protein, partial [Melioribacteraceae bacterium]|nr:T9SS type A sorting domain-containing protein [Melioribacteraceae bacterium]